MECLTLDQLYTVIGEIITCILFFWITILTIKFFVMMRLEKEKHWPMVFFVITGTTTIVLFIKVLEIFP